MLAKGSGKESGDPKMSGELPIAADRATTVETCMDCSR